MAVVYTRVSDKISDALTEEAARRQIPAAQLARQFIVAGLGLPPEDAHETNRRYWPRKTRAKTREISTNS